MISHVMYHLNSESLWFLVFHHPLQQDEGTVPLSSFLLLVVCSTRLRSILHHESNQLCATEPLRKFHFCINFPSMLSQTSVLFPSDFMTKICMHFLPIPCMLHINPYHIGNITASKSILVELWDLKTSSSSSSTVMLRLSVMLCLHFCSFLMSFWIHYPL